ncbi:MAG: hypothetical protein WAR21_02155 [Candidatus Acidiferrales bacterium]
MVESIPDSEQDAGKRRSTRIIQAVPLTVTGVDALGRPFQERTSTLLINCHGCRYQSKHYVLKNMWVTLEVPHPETGREPRTVRGRVTWIQRPRTVRELFQIGVELDIPGNVWGIAFPPEDWFAFPETGPAEISLPGGEAEAPAAPAEWELPGVGVREDNVHVLPGPSGNEASLTLARHVSRLVVEAKQQLQQTAREATAQAVAAETRPLLAAIHTQLKEAAEKAVQAAGASYAEQAILQTTTKIDQARQAGLDALQEKLSSEIQRHLQEASPRLAEELAQARREHQAGFQQQIENQLRSALERLNQLGGEQAASLQGTDSGVALFREQMEEAAEAAGRRWQETLERQSEEARARLEKLENATRRLNDEITAAASAAQAGWRGRLDADLAAAGTRWNDKIESSLESAARQTVERLARHSQAATGKLEQELTLRVAALRQSFEQATAEAESTLGTLRTTLQKETARAKNSLEEIQRAASRMEEYSAGLEALSRATSEELERRCTAVLGAQISELERRAEGAVAGMAERLQPVLESAGQQSVARLAAQLEQQLAPHLDRASQLMEKLATGRGLAEEAVRAHQERLEQLSDQSVQAAVAQLQQRVGRFEKEFQEAGRAATSRWLAELDARAADTQHTTFEAIYKSSEWYEKKVQTQMQAAIERGLEQASNSLREKAGEISGLFATELDHYSRSYVDHTQGQMDETVKEGVERARGQIAQAADTTAAAFGDRVHQAAQHEFERFTGSLGSAFEQTAARLETHLTQVRSRIDADARQFFVEFHKGMTQQIQQGIAQARQALEAELAPVKDSWRDERETQQRQLQEALGQLGNEAVDTYKKRLESVSNTWMLATVAKLSQQSQGLIGTLAQSAEQRLRETCSQVFAGVGETLRQRLLELSSDISGNTPPSDKKK